MTAFLHPQPPTIPLQLQAGQRHVIWKPEPRGDKIAKTPYNAHAYLQSGKLFKASATNEQSWSTFPQAVKAYEQCNAGGIGRVLGDGIMLTDIDHCFNRETQELHPAALEILSLFQQTYTELSPSGNGIHIFSLARLPERAGNVFHYKGLKIELYNAGRYSTLTGIPIPGIPYTPEVREQQSQVFTLIDMLTRQTGENTGVCVCVSPPAPAGTGIRASAHNPAHPARTKRDPAGTLPPANPGDLDPQYRRRSGPAAPAIREEDLSPSDQLVLERARSARNRETFWTLWNGGEPQTRRRRDQSLSAGDFALILLLLYWTGDSATNDCSAQVERLFKASRRYRPEQHEKISARRCYTNLQLSIYQARCKRYGVIEPSRQPEPEPPPAQPGGRQRQPARQAPVEESKRRRYEVINYLYEWMSRDFDQEARTAELRQYAQQTKAEITKHFNQTSRALYVAGLPPGVGKSHAFGELCDEYNIAVLVPRHELADGVAGYKKQRRIVTANADNCPDHEKHHRIAALGYNTRPVHKAHAEPCDYIRQFEEHGSAIYQTAHSETCYVSQHDGIIIEEFNLPDWIHERRYTVERLAKAAHQFATEAPASRYLVAWQATLTDFAHEHGPGSYQGRAVLDKLNKHLRGGLASLLGLLSKDYHATDAHPWPKSLEDEAELPEVVLPTLFSSVMAELVKWQRRTDDFNSCIRVVVDEKKQARLFITTPRRINQTRADGSAAALAMADATVNREILERWYGGQVTIERRAV
ncbi:MAG: hypothetical protein IMW89_15455 [Ktedonobacteraceae bacterium]|nr:hypothetical protein [Ktedonobacteraceae bacterium]